MKSFFTKLYGNKLTKQRIGSAVFDGTLAHAYLICGADGSGKMTLATEIAAAINCERRDSSNTLPCHECNTCRRISARGFIDVKTLTRSADKATIGVEEIRDFRDDMFLSSTESEYKIYIVDEAERLTVNAQNALLKVLEEPPGRVIIMLLAESSDSILTTIKSRTQYVAMERFDENALIDALKLKRQSGEITSLPEEDRLRSVLMNADGRIGRALSLTREKGVSETEAERSVTEGIVNALRQNTPYSELYTALTALPTKRSELAEAIESIISAICDLIRLKFDKNAPLIFFSSGETARELAASMTSKRLLGIYDIMKNALDDIQKNANVSAVTASLGAKIKLI